MKKQSLVHTAVLAALCTLPAISHAQTPAPAEPVPAPIQREQIDPTFQARALAGVEYDSNIYRSQMRQSDEVGMVGLGLRYDKRLGLQRFIADAEISRYQHRDLSDLSYNTLNYTAAWNWSVTPRFRGVARADRRQYRELPDTVEGFGQVGVRTDRVELVEGLYEIDGNWRALAGVTRTSSESDNMLSYDASPTVRSLSIGAAYEVGTGSSVTARLRRGDGEYKAFTQSDFQDNEAEVAVRWQFSPRTSVDSRLAYLRRTHDQTPVRDFSGLIGGATVDYELTGKTRLQAGIARDLASYYLATGGYVESNRVFIAPVWRPTAQTALRWRVQHERRSFKDIAGGSADQGRTDTISWAQVGFEWEPRRPVLLSATLRNERRKSSVALFNYRATVVGVAAKVTF